MSSYSKHKLNQRGIGSLLFTMIMIIVISLIVLGFAQLARRNQRQTLDSQLSTQAYYAAESGVNAALRILRSPHYNDSSSDNSECNKFINNNGTTSGQLSPASTTQAAYTCVLVDEGAQDSLSYQTVSPTNAVVVPINPVGSPLQELTFSWTKPTGATEPATNCQTNNSLPPAGSYNCPYGMVRIDMVPVTSGAKTMDSLLAGNKTFFIKPTNASTESTFGIGTDGPLRQARCNDTNCTATINGLSGSYALHISSVYAALPSLTITPNSDTKLAGAQVIIDSTGRAQDVLRRIRVRAPIDTQQVSVTGAIVSNQSVCKRFTAGKDQTTSLPATVGTITNCPN